VCVVGLVLEWVWSESLCVSDGVGVRVSVW
jgi:hypothetical protein